MVLVPAGRFLRGSAEGDGLPEERPQLTLRLSAFEIDVVPITFGDFTAFIEAGGYRTQALWSAEGWAACQREGWTRPRFHGEPEWTHVTGADQPACGVSFHEAEAYARWVGKRLPTEAEWEKAARGEDRRRYPWGDAPPAPDLAVYGRDYHATDRGDRRPGGEGPSGVQDLLGNLREWTASEYRPYPYRPDDGREASSLRATRVVRGASHDDPAEALRVTIRRFYSYDGDHRGLARGHHHTGFRCATSEDLGGR